MSLADLFAESLAAIRAHALRSFLTLLGIIIGVATIVGVVSVIAGLEGYVQEKILVLSPDVYVVTKFGIIRSREEFLASMSHELRTPLASILNLAESLQAGTYGGMDPRDADLLTDEEKQELENESEADNAARVR